MALSLPIYHKQPKLIMRNLILLALAATLTLASCSKDACEKNNTGSIKVNNQSARTGSIYMDNAYQGDIGAFGVLVIDNVAAGNVLLRFTTGGLNTSASVNVVSCQEITSNIY